MNEIQRRNYERSRMEYKYGVSLEEYEIRAERQEYRCAICGQEEIAKKGGKVKKLAIDHNHKTNEVRELLCQRCNLILGMVDDNYELLEKMVTYLKKWA